MGMEPRSCILLSSIMINSLAAHCILSMAYKALLRLSQLFYQAYFLLFPAQYSSSATLDVLPSGKHTRCFIVCMPLFTWAWPLTARPQHIHLPFRNNCQLPKPRLAILSKPQEEIGTLSCTPMSFFTVESISTLWGGWLYLSSPVGGESLTSYSSSVFDLELLYGDSKGNRNSGMKNSRLESQLCFLLAAWPWAGWFALLCL